MTSQPSGLTLPLTAHGCRIFDGDGNMIANCGFAPIAAYLVSCVNQMQETEGDPTRVDTLSSAIPPTGSTAASNEAARPVVEWYSARKAIACAVHACREVADQVAGVDPTSAENWRTAAAVLKAFYDQYQDADPSSDQEYIADLQNKALLDAMELSRLQGEKERLTAQLGTWDDCKAQADATDRANVRANAAEASLLAMRSKVTQIEQEMRGHATKSGNAGHRQLTKWADALAWLVNEHEAPESSPKPSLGDF